MDTTRLIRLLAGARVAFGLALFVAPRQTARTWLGDTVDDGGTRMAVRGLGARDVALGAGLLAAAEAGGPVRRWLEAGVVADLADAAASVIGRDARPAGATAATVAVAGSGAALGLWLRARATQIGPVG